LQPFPRGSAPFPWPKQPRAELARANLPHRLVADEVKKPGPSASFPWARVEGWGSDSATGEATTLGSSSGGDAGLVLRRRPDEALDRESSSSSSPLLLPPLPSPLSVGRPKFSKIWTWSAQSPAPPVVRLRRRWSSSDNKVP
jgi:hypothetical protein